MHRVVIVRCGFAGLFAAKALRRAQVEVVVVDRTHHHRLRGRELKPFRYIDLGTISTIARFRAVASIGRLQITGLAGWLMWLFVHPVLTGFKNRLSALANWAVAFLWRGRRQRTITEQQVLARTLGLELRDVAWVTSTTEMPVSRKLERQREHPAPTELVSPTARGLDGQP